MRRMSALLAGPALALMLMAGPRARADYAYNFSPIDFPTVYSDHSGMSINISNQPQVGPISTGLDTNVVAATLSTFINTGVTGADTFGTGQHATVGLTIIDGTDNKTVNFGLKFSGNLSATNSQITVALDGPSSRTLTVNGNTYTASLSSIVPPGVPGAIPGSVGGTIFAGIHVVTPPPPPGGGPPTGNAPEPSTMVLSCLGLSMLGAAGWRRLRGKAA